jgi:hypothetical protein
VLPSADDKSPIGQAAEWVARIASVALLMVLPGLGGNWLDRRWATEPLFTLSGFALGIAAGIWVLLVMTAAAKKQK